MILFGYPMCRVRTVGMNLADSLHSPLVIHHGKMIWMRQIILLLWMMSIHQSPDLGMSK